MPVYKILTNRTNPQSPALHTKICSDFFSRLAGLMFRKSIGQEEAIALTYPRASKLDSSIHMLFMNFDIAVFWLNDKHEIIDTVYAQKWKPYYAPAHPASIVVETHPDRLNDYHIHDQIIFEACEN